MDACGPMVVRLRVGLALLAWGCATDAGKRPEPPEAPAPSAPRGEEPAAVPRGEEPAAAPRGEEPQPAAPGCSQAPPPFRYVAPGGNDDGPGSQAEPFATIARALSELRVGTIVVAAGTYPEPLVFPPAERAPGEFLSVVGEPGAVVTHAPRLATDEGPPEGAGETDRSTTAGNLIYMQGVSRACVSGLSLVGAEPVDDASGIRIFGSGHHLEIVGNEVSNMRGTSAMGITVYGTDGEGISDVVIDYNWVHDSEPAPSEAIVVNGNVQSFRISNNLVTDVNNIGIDVIGGEEWLSSESPRDGVISENRVHRANANYDEGTAAGIYVDGASDITVERNRVSECDFGIEIGAENPGVTTAQVTVRDNFIHGNYKGGLLIGGYDATRGRVVDSLFVHNSLYQNNRPGQLTPHGFAGEPNGELVLQFASNCRIQDNIFQGAQGAMELVSYWGSATQLSLRHNLYHGAAGAQPPSTDEAPMLGEPRFVDPEAGDLHLMPESPAIGAGEPLPPLAEGEEHLDIDGQPRDRMAPDVGADEHSTP